MKGARGRASRLHYKAEPCNEEGEERLVVRGRGGGEKWVCLKSVLVDVVGDRIHGFSDGAFVAAVV